MAYGYNDLQDAIQRLKERFPFLQTGSAGKSVQGRELYYLRLGMGCNCVFYNGAHHGLEWITSLLLMMFAENYLDACVSGRKIRDYDVRGMWSNCSIYIIPMVNPDGVTIATEGPGFSGAIYRRLTDMNGGNTDFSKTWQANARGVDLNHNYPAKWEVSKSMENEYGIYGPGPTRYSGLYPLSEPESEALYRFTLLHGFNLVIAFHSQGEAIYWDYDCISLPESRRIGELLSKVSGYSLHNAEGIASYGGYKDWFINHYRKPGFTIEVGHGRNPVALSQIGEIYRDTEELMLLAASL
jgi:g-D-glutamyl-meso-diaminopimelate peptidase